MAYTKEPRLTQASLQVLRAFLDDADVPLAGSDIHRISGVLAGTLYPLLWRMEGASWLISTWEDIDPREAGRPRKRFYRLTDLGFACAVNALTPLAFKEAKRLTT